MSPVLTTRFAMCLVGWLMAETAWSQATVKEPPSEEALAAFEKLLSGSVLEGHFIDSSEPRSESPELVAERYEISRVRKLPRGNLWLFEARIVYGEHNVTVPIPLPVEWAGTTPVITLDQVSIPGLGTFDARVLIDGERYAGTWRHDQHGGHLFGRIRKSKSPARP
ncbi:MAG TPA: hypothetical protein VIY86_15250 [Pirellulaceae bacterium]